MRKIAGNRKRSVFGLFHNDVHVVYISKTTDDQRNAIQANSWLNDCFENTYLSHGYASRANGILNDMNQINFMALWIAKKVSRQNCTGHGPSFSMVKTANRLRPE